MAQNKKMSTTKFSTISINIHVPAEDVRAFRDPNGNGRKWYMCQVPVDEIHRARIEFGPNPRNQNMGTKVFEGIHDTLITKPEWFLYYSKGIVVNADEASYDNKTETLSIRLRRDDNEPWSSPGGNADGGHLQRAILNALDGGQWENPTETKRRAYVKLEVLTGIPTDELDDLVGARNTNLQVNELSLAVLGQKLDWLMTILDREGVNGEIAWRQFETGKMLAGKDVIAALSLINPEYTERERVGCYSSGENKLVGRLRHDETLMAGLAQCAPIAFKWLHFIDYLHSSFENWYKHRAKNISDEERRSGFGNLKGITIRPHRLVFLRTEIRYLVCKPWLLPIAGAFAPFARSEAPEEWTLIADQIGPVLLDRLIDFTNAEHNNLNAVGKRSYVWGGLAAEVKAAFSERRYARMSQMASPA